LIRFRGHFAALAERRPGATAFPGRIRDKMVEPYQELVGNLASA